MSKVTVIGAGNVGATVANVLAHRDIVNEIVLVDIVGDLSTVTAQNLLAQVITKTPKIRISL